MIEDTSNPQPRSLNKKAVVALLCVILLGAALRLWNLEGLGFWYDEASTFFMSQTFESPGELFDGQLTSEAPLFVTLTSLWHNIGEHVLGLERGGAGFDRFIRLLPVAAGVAGILVTFLIGRVLLDDEWTAVLGAYLFAISPFQIIYAQELRPYSFHALYGATALWCMIKALDTNDRRYWVGWVLCCTAGIYSQFSMVWTVVAFNVLFVLIMPWHYRRLGPWIVCNLAVIFLSIPALRLAFFVSGVYEQATEHWFLRPDLRMIVISFKNLFMGYSPNVPAYYAVLGLSGLLSLLGCWAARKRPRALLTLLVTSLGSILIMVLYWRQTRFPYYTYRLIIFSGVPLYILAAHGARALRRPALTITAIGLCTLGMAAGLADHYAGRLHPIYAHRIGVRYPVATRDASQYLAQHASAGDVIAHRTTYTLNSFRYYLNHLGLRQAATCFSQAAHESVYQGYPLPAVYDRIGLLPEWVEPLVADAPRAWVVESEWEPNPADRYRTRLTAWMDGHAIRESHGEFRGIAVYGYDNDARRFQDAEMLQVADFGDWREPVCRFPGDPPWTFSETERPPATQGLGLLLTSLETHTLPEGAFSYTIEPVLEATAMDLDFRIIESVEMADAMTFHRNAPMADIWEPVPQYDPESPKRAFNTFAMVAHLRENAPEDQGVYRDVHLPPGDYRIWAEIVTVGDGRAASRAEARFATAPLSADGTPGAFEPLAATDGSGGVERTRWAWRKLGGMATPGGASRLRITAHNVHGLKDAYFDMARVLFIRSGDIFEPEEFSVRLKPGEKLPGIFEGRLNGQLSKRVDLEIFAPDLREFRRIHFYVHAPQAATAGETKEVNSP